MAYVNIVTSDRGWILERLATEITSRLPYVRFSGGADHDAAIQYYITYSSRRAAISPIEVAFFAHLEEDQRTREKFFAVAREVDHCICMSSPYETLLRDAGIPTVTTVPPGVDLDALKPVVKIGVVGRTYHTGRKGEALVAQVMDVEGIEWHFTGDGWPGQALHLPHDGMAQFYNSMDYILVPALYEGGPMSVVEALACGRPVIAPPIGWVSNFPHIEYKTGDVDDLRRVLNEVVAERQRLRESVLSTTWDAWADGHDRVFRELMRNASLAPEARQSGSRKRVLRSATLFLHGSEATSQGGPTVRVPGTARHLRDRGIDAKALNFPDRSFRESDVVHGFNVWAAESSLAMARRVKEQGKPYIFSPIFLDLTTVGLWNAALPQLLASGLQGAELDAAIAAQRDQFLAGLASGRISSEPKPGYHAMVREMIALSDHIILLSEHERELLEAIGANLAASTVVHNPVDDVHFGNGDPAVFRDAYGVKDYVLCVARIEPRKNQAMLAHALRDTGLPIVLVGHAADAAYAETVRLIGGDSLTMTGRLPPQSELLASAIAGARAVVLPSWCEGAPLAALEAGSSGASMVLSDKSSEREYFGDFARYCDPGDAASIRRQILEAYEAPPDTARREAIREHVRQFSWQRYAEKTADVYHRTLESFEPAESTSVATCVIEPAGKPTIIFDVTTSFNHSGRLTGIARFEISLARALSDRCDVETEFVAWFDQLGRFVHVAPEALSDGLLKPYVEHAAARGWWPRSVRPGAHFIVVGSAWMQSTNYPTGVTAFCAAHDLVLTSTIADLVPLHFPFWFADGYTPRFAENAKTLLSASQRILAISENTRRDVDDFALRRNLFVPPIDVIRLGDEIERPTPGTEPSAEIIEALSDRDFVLAVGAIHERKNYRILYDVWTRLAAKLGTKCPRLVIVGGVAWNAHDLARAIKNDTRLTGVVKVLEGIEDATLDWLYENCIFTAYPSSYEGWGLPVGESLARGKICLASSASSIPEIAPTATDLLDPLDFAAWYTRVLLYTTSKSARAARESEIRKRYRGTSWAETAEQLVGILRSEIRQSPFWNVTTAGSVEEVGGPADRPILRQGWHRAERWGAWAAAHSATVRLRLAAAVVGAGGLMVKARALARQDNSLQCTVTIDGTTVGTMNFVGNQMNVFFLDVPAEVLKGRSEVDITFHSSRLIAIKDFTGSGQDGRNVGIGLESIALADRSEPFSAVSYMDSVGAAETFLRPGDRIDFSRDGKGRHLVLAKTVAVDTAWGMQPIEGPLALSLKVYQYPASDLALRLRYRAVASLQRPLNMFVTTGDGTVGSISASNSAMRETILRIPAESLRTQPLLLDFIGGDARSPADLKIGANENSFAIGLFGLDVLAAPLDLGDDDLPAVPLTPTARYELGRKISFEKIPSCGSVLASDYIDEREWHLPEALGTWISGRSASVRLRFTELPAHDLGFELELLIPSEMVLGREAAIEVRAGAVPVQTWNMKRSGALLLSGVIPRQLIDQDGNLLIEIASDASFIPSRLAELADDRDIGLGVTSLTLVERKPTDMGTITALSNGTWPSAILRGGEWQFVDGFGTVVAGTGGTILLNTPAHDGAFKAFLALTSAQPWAQEPPIAVSIDGATPTLVSREMGQPLFVEAIFRPHLDRHVVTLAASTAEQPMPALRLDVIKLAPVSDDSGTEAIRDAHGSLDALLFSAAGATAAPLSLGTPLAICGPDVTDAMFGNWHAPEEEWTWASDKPVGLRLSLPTALEPAGGATRPATNAAVPEDIELRLDFAAFGGAAGSKPISVQICVEGKPIADLQRSSSEFRVECIPMAGALADLVAPSFSLAIVPSHAISPAELGESSDTRALSIALRTVTLARASDPLT